MARVRVYIGGKVSGLAPEDYHAKFEAARSWLANILGEEYEVVIPMDFCQDDWSWFRCMEVCVEELLKCDNLYLLPDWKDSQGATAEYYIARTAGIPIVEIDQWQK